MADANESPALLLEAMSFAARAHRHQLRKDGDTPYVSHPFRVCFIVSHVFGITDPVTLLAAVLHDTIEDTTTDHDDLCERFGSEVATVVAALSKDSRLPQDRRESAYLDTLVAADDRVKIIKLADTFDNLIDSRHLPPHQRAKTLAKAENLLDRLEPGSSEQALRLISLVRQRVAATRTLA